MLKKILNLKLFRAGALALALALPVAPAALADEEITCEEGSDCRLVQTFGSAFDCIVVRGGRVFDRGRGAQCEGLGPLNTWGGTEFDACFTTFPESDSYPKCTIFTSTAGLRCPDGEGHFYIVVNPENNQGYHPWTGAETAWEHPRCRLIEDTVALGGDLRPKASLPDADCTEAGMRAVAEWGEEFREEYAADNARAVEQAGQDLLRFAGKGSREYVCKQLLLGADPNFRAPNNATALHKTSQARGEKRAAEAARYLVLAGADINAQNDNGLTPLDRAKRSDGWRVALELLEHDAECNVYAGHPFCLGIMPPPPLSHGCSNNDMERFHEWHVTTRRDFEAAMPRDELEQLNRDLLDTVLNVGTTRRSNVLEMCALLLKGADPRYRDPENGETLMHKIVRRAMPGTTGFLYMALGQTDANLKDNRGATPRDLAVELQHTDPSRDRDSTFTRVSELGGNCRLYCDGYVPPEADEVDEVADSDGPRIPEFDCSRSGMEDLREWREENPGMEGFSESELTAAGLNLLVRVAVRSDVCGLLQAGADPNFRAARNQATALHKAVGPDALDSAEFLLLAGADPNLQNSNGMTALDRAVRLKRPEMAELLRNFGGECNRHIGHDYCGLGAQ